MPDPILQSEATAALRETTVLLTDFSGDGVTGIAGTVTIKIAKSGGNLGAPSATTITEITGGAEVGLYRLRFGLADVDTVGDLSYEITQTGVIAPCRGAVGIKPALRSVDIASAAGDAIAVRNWAALHSANHAAGSMGDQILSLLMAAGINVVRDTIVSGSSLGIITSARVRGWIAAAGATAATPGHGDGTDSEDGRITMSAVDAGGGVWSSMKLVRSF